MKPEILLIEPMMPEVEAQLDAAYQVHRLFEAKDPAALVARVAPAIRGVATGGAHGVANAVFDALPNLEIIAINGIGTDAVDLERARARGVRVATTPGVLTDDVADLAIGLMLAVSRRFCVADRFVRDGRWPNAHLPLSAKLSGKRLGIFGLGHVGRSIGRRAEGFDMPIAYCERNPAEVAYRFVPDLEELALNSDFLVIAASGGSATHGIVNRRVLDALGPQGVLINVARGSIVDEEALVFALIEGRLGGAGLDVFVHEPNVPEALWAMDNVVLSPHQASATVETRRAMADLVLANLAAHFAGQELPTPVV
ncbi:MAG: 2-hydroxyacid dehydrogenase [Stellaceae bacterium]